MWEIKFLEISQISPLVTVLPQVMRNKRETNKYELATVNHRLSLLILVKYVEVTRTVARKKSEG